MIHLCTKRSKWCALWLTARVALALWHPVAMPHAPHSALSPSVTATAAVVIDSTWDSVMCAAMSKGCHWRQLCHPSLQGLRGCDCGCGKGVLRYTWLYIPTYSRLNRQTRVVIDVRRVYMCVCRFPAHSIKCPLICSNHTASGMLHGHTPSPSLSLLLPLIS